LANPKATLSYIIDKSADRAAKAKSLYPTVKVESEITDKILEECNAFIIATPINTHYIIAKDLLESGKNVLVQKPMTNSIYEAEILEAIAKMEDVVLMTKVSNGK